MTVPLAGGAPLPPATDVEIIASLARAYV